MFIYFLWPETIRKHHFLLLCLKKFLLNVTSGTLAGEFFICHNTLMKYFWTYICMRFFLIFLLGSSSNYLIVFVNPHMYGDSYSTLKKVIFLLRRDISRYSTFIGGIVVSSTLIPRFSC